MGNILGESEEDGIKRRFAEEFEKIDEPKKKLAALIGVAPQTFTNLTKGYNMASVLVLSRLKFHYPTFDVNYIVSGVRSTDDSQVVKSLRSELAREKAISTALLGKTKGATIRPGVDRKHYKASCHQVMSLGRRRVKAVFTPGRVQESEHAPLISDYLQRVRMQ